MKTTAHRVVLQIASLLSLLLITLHLTGDVVLQKSGAVQYPIPVVISVIWLYGALALRDRLAGAVIMLLGGLMAAGMIVIHSPHLIVQKTGGYFFIWTLFALAATGWFTVILAATQIWNARRASRHRAASPDR